MTEEINSDEQLIEGGEITSVDWADIIIDPLKKQRAETTRKLAYLLVVILALSFAIHYGMTSWLLLRGNTAGLETLGNTFSTWLPVISGLTSSAVTYYFTKEK